MTDPVAAPGLLELREPPDGMPDAEVRPPIVAESDDPFAAVRIVSMLARIPRGQPIRIADVADALNAAHLDWLFEPAVVMRVALQLQANWMADYRNASGMVLDEGPYGPTIAIEDSSRVDPWIVEQGRRYEAACYRVLLDFSRQDRPGSND